MQAAAIDPYATGVLKKEHHGRLVADLANIAMDAAIRPHWIYTSLLEVGSEAEVSWVKSFRANVNAGVSGLCIVGKNVPKVEDRMSAIAGALVRNFIRAKVVTVASLIEQHEEGATPDPTCLLIPNFFIGKTMGGDLPTWRIAKLHDILVERHMSGRQTVLYVTDMKNLAAEYGTPMAGLIESHYKIVNVK